MIFLTYLLESSVCAAILWLAYHALLRKDTHFAFNRFYLLSVIPLSSLIPLLRLPLLPPAAHAPLITIEQIAANTAADPLVETAATQSFPIITLLLIVYFSGAGVVAFRFIRQLYHMHRVIATSRFSDTKNYSAFTFFRKIYINGSTLQTGDYEKILWHEQVHARQLHSIDLIVAQLFVMMQWFNPFAWTLRKSIVATHEYLADAQVLARGVDVNIYQQLLFHQTIGAHPEYASGFSYSLTKKRLIMMTKNNTGKFFALKLCGLLPALALPVGLFGLSAAEANLPVNATVVNVETHAQATDSITITDISNDERLKELSTNVSSIAEEVNTKTQQLQEDIQNAATILTKLGETLVLNSGDERLLKDLSANINSIAGEVNTKASQLQKEIQNTKITILKKSGETLVFSNDDDEVKSFEEVQELLKDTDNISSITVQKDTAKTKVVRFTTPKRNDAEKVYLVGQVDVNPEFPGGNDAMMQFLFDNLKYPKEAAEKKIKGRVTMAFDIKADGKIDNVKVQKGIDPLLDAEAMRVVLAMPAWTPGKHKGKAVAVHFVLPIVFQLSKEKGAEGK